MKYFFKLKMNSFKTLIENFFHFSLLLGYSISFKNSSYLKFAFFSHFIAGGNRWNGGIELIPAKIPILKFKDKFGNLEVDLSVDNPAR